MSAPIKVGVIGGSGLYDLDGMSELEEISLATPFGAPSDAYRSGTLGDVPVVFLPRHGRGHLISPSEINFRANVWGLKQLGVTHVLSVSAVGSLVEDVVPGHFVVVDQFIDRTRHRVDTFFEGGVVAHVMFADPVCPVLRRILLEAGAAADITVHDGGTYVNMEGPQFSTRAESQLYRSWGAKVIGMTNLQEAKLAREAAFDPLEPALLEIRPQRREHGLAWAVVVQREKHPERERHHDHAEVQRPAAGERDQPAVHELHGAAPPALL